LFISEELRRTNIAEYVLYMWQTEDMLRSLGFDIHKIQEAVIDKHDVSDELKDKLRNWYSGFIQMAELENIQKEGHLQVIKNVVNDMNDLHLWLLTQPSEVQYKKYYETAQPNIQALASKMQGKLNNEIDICMHGLYAQLLLSIQKKDISPETSNAFESFRQLIALLAAKYHDREENPDKYYE
jgi:hypothetical protein